MLYLIHQSKVALGMEVEQPASIRAEAQVGLSPSSREGLHYLEDVAGEDAIPCSRTFRACTYGDGDE
jgi:hypothetical protein